MPCCQVVTRGTGNNYGVDGFLRPGFHYTKGLRYLWDKMLERRESHSRSKSLLSSEWLAKFAAALVPRGLEFNRAFLFELRAQLQAHIFELFLESAIKDKKCWRSVDSVWERAQLGIKLRARAARMAIDAESAAAHSPSVKASGATATSRSTYRSSGNKAGTTRLSTGGSRPVKFKEDGGPPAVAAKAASTKDAINKDQQIASSIALIQKRLLASQDQKLADSMHEALVALFRKRPLTLALFKVRSSSPPSPCGGHIYVYIYIYIYIYIYMYVYIYVARSL